MDNQCGFYRTGTCGAVHKHHENYLTIYPNNCKPGNEGAINACKQEAERQDEEEGRKSRDLAVEVSQQNERKQADRDYRCSHGEQFSGTENCPFRHNFFNARLLPNCSKCSSGVKRGENQQPPQEGEVLPDEPCRAGTQNIWYCGREEEPTACGQYDNGICKKWTCRESTTEKPDPPQEGEKDMPCCGMGSECDDISSTGHCLGHPLCPYSVLDQPQDGEKELPCELLPACFAVKPSCHNAYEVLLAEPACYRSKEFDQRTGPADRREHPERASWVRHG